MISICLGGVFGYPPPGLDPFAGRPLWLKILWVALFAPLYETFLFQWLIIKFLRGPLRRSWGVAGVVSTVVFGFGHGHTDWRAIRMLATAAIPSAIFIIEARRSGPAFRATFATHALFNNLTIALSL